MQMAIKSQNPIAKLINQNFIIRYKFIDENKTHLVGAGQYHNIVGKEIANKHFERALNSKTMKTTIKVRNHLKIDFVSK